MNLSTRLAGHFSAPVRKKGQRYYWERRVRIVHGSESELEARVRGSSSYEVTLDWDHGNQKLWTWCDCAYYDSSGPCKHLWAAILGADAHGFLSGAASANELSLDVDEEFEPDESIEPSSLPEIPKPSGSPDWLKQVKSIGERAQAANVSRSEPLHAKRQIIYAVDVAASTAAGCLVLALETRSLKADGSWAFHGPLSLKRSQIPQLRVREDREILAALAGARQHYSYGYLDSSYDTIASACRISHPLAVMALPAAIRTGRCYLRMESQMGYLNPLSWDEGSPWQFGLDMHREEKVGWAVTGVLRRGEERMDAKAALLVTPGGLVFTSERVALLAESVPFEWLSQLRKMGRIKAPEKERDRLLAALLCSPGAPPLDVPEELRFEEVMIQPQPRLRITAPRPSEGQRAKLKASLSFAYEGWTVSANEAAGSFWEAASRRVQRRHVEAEESAAARLRELGTKLASANYYSEPAWEIASTKLPRIARVLVQEGWHIEADGKTFRRPGTSRMDISSGVDWFELHGEVEYGETTAKMPALLEALRRGEHMVRLDDGSYGVLPEEWLRRIGPIAGLGTFEEGHIRFRRSQAGLLDALLATQPETSCDETFARVRQELRLFQGVDAAEQPAGFVGQLRDYQREGLGWLHFLRRFALGGCLADDMGVGKTAQVLALLETRRALRASGDKMGPSLVVVPRSLIFNWKQEAARFTPQLRVLDYTGIARENNGFREHDIVLTTYGTLRRDIPRLKDVEFDYIVLDEAQAIKNANTDSSKAVRLLRGAYRVAVSGTPIENHLGELWSLFEFLNPGMLGAASVFKMQGGGGRNPDEDTRRMLAQALRPFILRRTKDQVARELPPRTEQTVYCVMEAAQHKLYNELREHYRNALLKRIDTNGLAKSKIQVLEALLRLRQAACHPGLLDPKRRGEPSAKLDVLVEQLSEVLEAGHKALVFSQFTSLLSIVRERLDSRNAPYEYLDGATHDRQSCVERFQNDPDCKLFLISLKAGGLGLNLTAAEYVFLLDPWWNPAVEAQAVDRAHRIGQTRHVFAYRLIARDTVEEKVLELQNSKRDLAAAIISEDNSLLRNLRREDLEILLS